MDKLNHDTCNDDVHQGCKEMEVDTSKLMYLRNHKKWAKYLKDDEEAITEDELKRRKRKYFTDNLFYK